MDSESPRLITVDELRAAGALEVPDAWRKSLGVERDLFDLFGEESQHDDEKTSTPDESDDS
jgi:hypothetical protein